MTSPDFIVVMRKTKAIITDIGGITAHVAIEVDANKGIVKIIKRESGKN